MKIKRNWTEIAEYGSLVGLVVALIYRQIAVAPFLSVFIWLNLKNRRYLEHVTSATIQNAIQPAFVQLDTLALTLQSVSDAQVKTLEFKQFTLDELEKAKTSLRQKVEAQAINSHTVQTQLEQFFQTVKNLNSQLEQQSQSFDSSVVEQKMETLDQQIQEVQQQLLPLADPGFISLIQSLKEETASLQLVQQTKLSLAALEQQVRFIKQKTGNLQTEYAYLRERAQHHDLIKQQVQNLGENFERLNEGMQVLSSFQTALAALEQQFKTVERQVGSLDADCLTLQERTQKIGSLEKQTQTLAVEFEVFNKKTSALEATKSSMIALEQQLRGMRQQVDDLDESCATLHDHNRNIDQVESQVQGLSNRIQILEPLQNQIAHLIAKRDRVDEIEAMLTGLSDQFKGQVDKSVERYVDEINQQLQQIQPNFEYQLVFDRRASRERLLIALNECTKRLILVCPWLTRYAIEGEVIQKLRQLLNENRRVDVGWGHLKEIDNLRGSQGGSIRENLKNNFGWKYAALNLLEELEGPNLRLKLLGTHEKYLVCDRKFAVVGSHNFLTSDDGTREREIGIYTTDPRLIDELIKRFEVANNREEELIRRFDVPVANGQNQR